MVKAIVTRQNADGSFDNVGMNNRTVVGPYKTVRKLFFYGIRANLKQWAGDRVVRVEMVPADRMYGPILSTYYLSLLDSCKNVM